MAIKLEIGDDIDQKFDRYAMRFGTTKEQLIQEAIMEKLTYLEELKIAESHSENTFKLLQVIS